MNQHSGPPGGWEPPEPHWVKRADRIAALITLQVERHIRVYRRGWLIWLGAGMGGYWIGAGSVALLKWWLDIK